MDMGWNFMLWLDLNCLLKHVFSLVASSNLRYKWAYDSLAPPLVAYLSNNFNVGTILRSILVNGILELEHYWQEIIVGFKSKVAK